MVKLIFLEEFGKAFVPARFAPNLKSYLQKAGIPHVPYKFFGGAFYLTAILTGIIYIMYVLPLVNVYSIPITLLASSISWFGIQLLLAFLTMGIMYFFLDVKIYIRTRKMEAMLPDFLQIVTSNLKGGMAFENALWGAIKPRFTILSSEMSEVSKKVMTGYNITKALREFGQKYNSPTLRRTIDLVTSEIESGGHVTDIIDKIVANLKETKHLKEEISASVVTYTIFIGVIVIVMAPLLFALSFNLLLVITGFIGELAESTGNTESLPFEFDGGAVDPGQFKLFSFIAIFIIAFFSALIIAIVEKGDIKGGLKYIPIFLLGSFGFYMLFSAILTNVFSGFVPT